jgi:hypothetical protein
MADSDSDDVEIDRRVRQSLRLPAAPTQKDIEQDAMIRSLKRETQELRIYVAALVRLLAQKETLAPAEVEELIALADRVRHEIRPRESRHRPKVDGLIYPPEAA